MNDLEKRTLTIQKTFNVPIQVAWDAWTNPEHIVHWWGPKGMNTRVVKHEFREGGSWVFAMTMPDGKDFITEGVYKEIEEPHKIISSADFKPMTEGVEIQAIFEEDGELTQFTFNVIHPTEEYCRQQEEMGFYNGWGSTFERLGEFLQSE